MGRKVIFACLLLMLAFPLISATATIATPYNLTVGCDGFTCGSLSITILFPNSSTYIDSASMTDNTQYASYLVTPPVYGQYNYYYSDTGNYSSGSFMATSTGYELSTGSAVVYFSMFLVIAFIFVITIFGINSLPPSNQRDEEGKLLSISMLKYLRPAGWFFVWIMFVATLFLSSNLAFAYLGEQLFAKLLFSLYRIAFGVTPIIAIAWFVWIFTKIADDRTLYKLMKRGMDNYQI